MPTSPSATTIVGYGSRWGFEDGGDRACGLTAIVGKFTCPLAALAIVPGVR